MEGAGVIRKIETVVAKWEGLLENLKIEFDEL